MDMNKEIIILKKYVKNLLSSEDITCSELNIPSLPENGGVYIFLKDGQIVYVGLCGVKGKKGTGTLKSRIGNHFTANFGGSTLKNKLRLIENINTHNKAKHFIMKNFSLRYLELDDKQLISRLEHFLIAIYNPKYND